MGLSRPHQHAAGHLSAHAESPQWQSSKESRTFTRCRATQATARDKPQPRGADGAGWGPRELRPGQRVLEIRRDAIRPPQGASACTSRGGRSGGARPRPHTPPCAASAQPRSLGGGRGRCAPGTLSGKVGREKGLLPTERGPRDTEGSASQAGRGACPWSRGPATEESRRAACPGPGCPASAPVLGTGTFLCFSRPPWEPAAGAGSKDLRVPLQAWEGPSPTLHLSRALSLLGVSGMSPWGRDREGSLWSLLCASSVEQEPGPRIPEGGSGARGGRRGSEQRQAVSGHSPPRPWGRHQTRSFAATMEPDLTEQGLRALLSRAEDRSPCLAGHTGSIPTPRFRRQKRHPWGMAGCQ